MADAAYSERLWPGPGGWVAAAALGAVVGLVLAPIDVRLAWAAGAVAVAGALAATAALTPVVEVSGGELRAGRAHVPTALLGAARALTGAELRAALGPGLDARAYVCLRGWIRTAVRVELADPQDPTPYWIISTRRPDAVIAALTDPPAPSPP
jgi:hypothetical protein